MKSALCIGGLDTSGARGIAPAAAAISMHGVRPLSAVTAMVTSGRRGPLSISWTAVEVVEGMIDAAVALGADVALIAPPLTAAQLASIAQKIDEHGLKAVVDTTWRGPAHRPLIDEEAIGALKDMLFQRAAVVIAEPDFLVENKPSEPANSRAARPLTTFWLTGAQQHLIFADQRTHQLPAVPARRPAGMSIARSAALVARLARGESPLISLCEQAQAFALAAASEGDTPPGEQRKIVGYGGPATRAAARCGVSGSIDPTEHADDEKFMNMAIAQAAIAAEGGDVPVGAVIVKEGKVIAAAHNRREADNDPVAHAEILVLQQAAQMLGSWRLTGCTLYVTLEPCFMCAGALVNARIERLVVGTLDKKAGATHSLAEVTSDPRLNHRVAVCAGVCQRACSEQLLAPH